MEYRIIEKGVSIDGAKAEIGQIVEVDGDMPVWLVGKAEPVAERFAVTNPAQDPVKEPVTREVIEAMDKPELAEILTAHGVDIDGRWSADRLRAKALETVFVDL